MTELRSGIIRHTECSWLDAGKPFTLWPLPLKFSYKIEQFKITQSSPVFPSVTYRAAKKKKSGFHASLLARVSLCLRRWERMWARARIDKPSVAVWHTDRKSLSHDWDIGTLSDCTEGLLCMLPAQIQAESFIYTERERERGWEQSREKRKCWGFFCGEFQRC